jgi:hypothetical protein
MTRQQLKRFRGDFGLNVRLAAQALLAEECVVISSPNGLDDAFLEAVKKEAQRILREEK